MESIIIKPKNEILRKYIQYFLFFKNTENAILSYTTFPNNNLCLAIYKQNEIKHVNKSQTNRCIITQGSKPFVSKLYGFHKTPFQVDINSSLDQVCIIFHPSALRSFTNASYTDLMKSDTVFEDIFLNNNDFLLEQIFEEDDFAKRTQKLESLLLGNLKHEIPDKLKEGLYFISKNNNENLTVETLCKNLKISESSLFRLFKNNLGQNPKSYLKTIRFRNILDEIMLGQNTHTEVDYLNQYYDQAHFINDFKTHTGYSPKSLIEKVSVQQNDLTWIYNKMNRE
ncbi:helix-turn-helix transcriptional regulator [Flavobacterium degerlachei]|jgi:AraC-like DNA-binding protein|uniref:Transcriptional regulator, AraC family n=1 Tax=Flavobacterium degerlachei TaxID=229203 RepID=A0A1H2SX23_9FLAO|nr:helix-turn-helix transcriptional regulator [Flavobacterium degerlachei]SDW35564.1 transcriptional regulator, AraC family [Flavobacterium degerlachei]